MNDPRLKVLDTELAGLVAEERALIDKCKKDKRSFDATEKEGSEKREARMAAIEKEIQELRAISESEDRTARRESDLAKLRAQPERPGAPADDVENPSARKTTPEVRKAFRSYLRVGRNEMPPVELRALEAGLDTSGGYLVPPMEFIAQLLQNVDDVLFIRARATKFQVARAESIGVPQLDADPADADWTSELATGSEDTAMAFGRRELHPRPLAKRIKVSNKLLRQAAIDPEALVISRLAYKSGVTQEKSFLTGTGAGQPLGLFTASADGIPTSRDVSTGNTTTSIGADGLIEAKHSLKGQYWAPARWVFHRDSIKQIRKLKDGNGQYLWTQGFAGTPMSILDTPYDMSEYAPNTFTTGKYVGLIGDLSRYWIVDALDMQFQRLAELYAETNQTGFIVRMELDGAPVLSEAFIRVTLA